MNRVLCLASTSRHPILSVTLPKQLATDPSTDDCIEDLMRIGHGATGKVTSPEKEGGIVAIYYLGTLIGALMYDH